MMMLPSVFGESLFDDALDFPFDKRFFGRHSPLYGKRAKNLNLTEAGRALAEKTIARVVRAEAAAICRMGLERMETDLAIRQGYLQKLREEFTQLKEKTDGHKTENL